MIRLGLCSGACITRDIKSVIAIASAAGLDAIEWAADVHIGAEDLRGAEEAMMNTLMAGLTTASYATLYRAGSENGDCRRFDALLKVASVMQAPMMRLFAIADKTIPLEEAGGEDRAIALLSSVLRRLGDRAAERGITLCLSMSRGSCLDRYDRAARLAEAVDHDFIRLAWEDLPGSSCRAATEALASAGPLAAVLIARSATRDGKPVAIAQRRADWQERLRSFRKAEIDSTMGSFVLLAAPRSADESGQASLSADAAILRELVSEG